MQERYLGDVHDFVKYALLRFLAVRLGLRLGVNWYLTGPESDSSDGENRAYLSESSEWANWEPDLFERILGLQNRSNRQIERVGEIGILPADTIYYKVPVPTVARHFWHQSAQTALDASDFVFLDPDNGFQVKSMTTSKRTKYALFSEAVDFFRAGKVVICIQFAPRMPLVRYARERRSELHSLSGTSARLPVVRGRGASPNILFFTLAPSDRIRQVDQTLRDFSASSPKYQDGRRVEIID